MRIVNDNLVAGLSLVDKIWNDAMETAALVCEDEAAALCASNGESESWVWPCARIFVAKAAQFRAAKRAPALAGGKIHYETQTED